jgi:hypothetical protein
MSLLPALIACLLLGATPLGSLLAGWLNQWLDWGEGVCLAVLYLLIYTFGIAILKIISQIYSTPTAEENDWFRFGDIRGQGWVSSMLSVTIILGVIAGLFQPSSAWSLGCLLVFAFVGVSANLPIRRTLWPPDIAPFVPVPLHNEDFLIDAIKPKPGDTAVAKHFSWYYEAEQSNHRGNFDLQVYLRQSEIDRFRTMEHRQPQTYEPAEMRRLLPPYVSDGTSLEVEYIAARLSRQAQQLQLGYIDFVQYVIAFVNGIVRYTSDQELYGRREYWAYPMETLDHERGDCEDSAILLVALLRSLGLDVILIHILQPSHLAVGVALRIDCAGRWVDFNGKSYFYIEATQGPHWRIGQLPPDINLSPETFVPVGV